MPDGDSWSASICGDPACYRGRVANWNYQYKDGPCASPNCKWPKDTPTRPHFSENAMKLNQDPIDKHWWFST